MRDEQGRNDTFAIVSHEPIKLPGLSASAQ
jgi:hypothetical protein